jgi:hypothetical protein
MVLLPFRPARDDFVDRHLTNAGEPTRQRRVFKALAPRAKPQAAFRTLPDFRQRVHTYSRRGVPPTSMRTFCRFGLKRRLVATIEWLRLFPNAGPFPHA